MKFNNYKFWISLLAGIIVLISTLGTIFDFSVNEVAITSIGTAVLGIFVTLGFIKKEEKNQEKQSENNLTENVKAEKQTSENINAQSPEDENQSKEITQLLEEQKCENKECFEQLIEKSKQIESKLNSMKNGNKNK